MKFATKVNVLRLSITSLMNFSNLAVLINEAINTIAFLINIHMHFFNSIKLFNWCNYI